MGIQSILNVVHNYRKSLFHLAMLTSIVTASALTNTASTQEAPTLVNVRRPAIPYCGDESLHERTIGRRLLYITTLDGRLSALDITNGGKLHWSIPTGPGPLISSSIHRLELTNNGEFVRMIPSLSGGIYKFDGESIDPIPITTDNLLSSSSKFSDDLVISGGKETRTYGVSARTGKVLYECSMDGCLNATNDSVLARSSAESTDGAQNDYIKEHDPLIDDVIVVRRQTQTVRAVETRTGVERWNFSVGQHELDMVKSAECHEHEFSDLDMAILDLDVKVVVPEGLICAFSKTEPTVMLWKYKFDHPIVSGWKIDSSDQLEAIDMFGSAQWLWNQDENRFEAPIPNVSPSIYLGMYEKQLYIQESINIRREIDDQSNLYTHLTTNEPKMPKIPWRPIAVNSNSLMLVQKNDKVITDEVAIPPMYESEVHGNELVPYDEGNFALAAQSVLNASEYVNGNGFYLYANDDFTKVSAAEAICDADKKWPTLESQISNNNNNTNRTITDELGFSLDDIDAPVKVVILSLWFWWKEIVVIAFTSAVVLNALMGHRHRPEREIVVIERHIPVPTAMEATESSTAALLGPTNTTTSSKSHSNGFTNGSRTLSESTTLSGELFTSRFQSDFDLMRCLGRGGFGVVFEAKNKLDDCKYAVKRITLPNKKESRDRVMREVKTLANCEHQNIVRYFQAWVETPPPGWQEDEDSKWLAHEMSTSIQIETPDGTTFPSIASSSLLPTQQHDHQTRQSKLQQEKKKQLLSWVSSVTSTACSLDHEHENSIAERVAEEEEEDASFIVFRSESQSQALREEDEQDELPSNAVAIDIHSNSIDLNPFKNGHKRIDYTQLSDSFQIEFVRSANGDEHLDEIVESGADSDDEADSKTQSKLRTLSSEHNRTNNNNKNLNKENSCKALVHAQAATVMPVTPKPVQNKVYLYIQMQLCRKESLRDWLRDNTTKTRVGHIALIFHQIVDAVEYVHQKGLIHRDLKPSNIFFSQDGQIKIGDFGLVTDMSDIPNLVTECGDKTGMPSCARHTQQVGTHLYMSPEQLRGKHYDYKVDIYSLGLIFFELLVYFGTEMERIQTLRKLRDGLYPTDFPVEHAAEYDLLKLMLSTRPDERPSTFELKTKLVNILQLPDVISDVTLMWQRSQLFQDA